MGWNRQINCDIWQVLVRKEYNVSRKQFKNVPTCYQREVGHQKYYTCDKNESQIFKIHHHLLNFTASLSSFTYCQILLLEKSLIQNGLKSNIAVL